MHDELKHHVIMNLRPVYEDQLREGTAIYSVWSGCLLYSRVVVLPTFNYFTAVGFVVGLRAGRSFRSNQDYCNMHLNYFSFLIVEVFSQIQFHVLRS